MPNTKSKNNTVFITIAILIILGGALYFFYFSNSGDNGLKNKTETSAAEADSSSLKKLQNMGEFSQLKGEDLLGLLNLMQTIKLDLAFFQSEKFKKLNDFYRVLEIKEEEKGNPNLFKVQ